MAGGVWTTANSSYYLYTNQYYWTGSPVDFENGFAGEFSAGSSSSLSCGSVNNAYGARPVVSLTSDIVGTGSGTWNDPYIIN